MVWFNKRELLDLTVPPVKRLLYTWSTRASVPSSELVPPSPHARVFPPLDPKGGGHTRLRVKGWGDPIWTGRKAWHFVHSEDTTGEKAWHSVYSEGYISTLQWSDILQGVGTAVTGAYQLAKNIHSPLLQHVSNVT